MIDLVPAAVEPLLKRAAVFPDIVIESAEFSVPLRAECPAKVGTQAGNAFQMLPESLSLRMFFGRAVSQKCCNSSSPPSNPVA